MAGAARFASGSGPGPLAADGCAVDLYAAMPPGLHEAALISGIAGPQATILELGAGAGRVTHPLVELGHRVTAVDDSPDMLARIVGADTVLSSIEELRLDQKFDLVVLASHLVNIPDDNVVLALLRTCSHHVAAEGHVLVERWGVNFFENVRSESFERDGIEYEFSNINRASDELLSATVTYRLGGRTWTQTFTTRRLTDPALSDLVDAAGLTLDSFADDQRTWAVCSTKPEMRLAH